MVNPDGAPPAAPAPAITPSVADPAISTGGPPAAVPTAAPPAGTARYALAEEIARGGMGAVFRATDTALGREVAVKVLRDGHATDSDAARRFADEARITGQLQHPAIPPVHDLGVLPDGRPFLAMKLIKGQTLERLLAVRPDVAAERGRFVAVFEQVCQALAFAHSHDVIHRDLKPANVMVGAFGEVQVMDWGLAKVLTERPAEATSPEVTTAGTQVVSLRDSDGAFTQAGSVLGTPAYMPPEQAVGAVGKVDRRSDVFGLGAILAVILTGRPPYHAASAETTRVKAAQGDVTECLARLDGCGAEPDLVALCKRCLCPRQEDRPADAGEVARAVAELRAAADERARRAELDRVKAEGDKAAAQLQTAEQRKRRWVQAALGLTFTATLVLGVAGLWWADRQRGEQARVEGERAAEHAAAVERARQAAKAALVLAADLRDQFRYAAAVQAIDQAAELIPPDAPADIRESLDEARGDTLLVRDLEEIRFGRIRSNPYAGIRGLASAYREAFAARGYDPAGTDPAAADWAARSPVRLALSATLIDWAQWERGVTRARLLAVAHRADPSEWGDRLRDPANWGADAARNLAAQAPIADLAPHHLVLLLQFCKGPWPGARQTLLAAAARRRADFWVQFEIGFFFAFKQRDPRAAVGPLRAALALRPDCVYALHLLADALRDGGDTEAALVEYQAEQDMFQSRAAAHPDDAGLQSDLADSLYHSGVSLADAGKRAEGVKELEQARDIRQKLADAQPDDAGLQSDLADSRYHLGVLLADIGRRAESVEELKQARDIRQKLADARPGDADLQSALAWCHYNLAMVLADAGRTNEALKEQGQARDIRQKLAALRSDDADLLRNLALSLACVGDLLRRAGRTDEALEEYQQARDVRQKLADAHPDDAGLQGDLADSRYRVGLSLADAGRRAEAVEELKQARDVRQKLADAHPDDARIQSNLAWCHYNLAMVLVDAGRTDEALKEQEQARDIRQRLADARPDDAGPQDDLAESLFQVGNLLRRASKPEEALKEHQQARDILQRLADAHPTNLNYQSKLALIQNNLGRLQARLQHFPEAFAAIDAGLALRQKLVADHPTVAIYGVRLGFSYAYRGAAHVRAGQPADGAADLRRALDLIDQYMAADGDARFERSRALALLGGLGAEAKSGVGAAEAAAFADRAVADLEDAIGAGWTQPDELKEPDFDALRRREDFQKLVNELEAKAAAGRPTTAGPNRK